MSNIFFARGKDSRFCQRCYKYRLKNLLSLLNGNGVRNSEAFPAQTFQSLRPVAFGEYILLPSER